jgi:predicted RNA-binding Zn ribbon-like protein
VNTYLTGYLSVVPPLAERRSTNFLPFIFVGDHPAIDFANTLSTALGPRTEHLGVWQDLVDWLVAAGLSTDPAALQVPAGHSAEALKSVVVLRQAWKAELAKMVAGGKVSPRFITELNLFLAGDVFHETLVQSEKNQFHVERSTAELHGEQLALALLSRQMAHFLAAANLEHLHQCANTTTCVLYFYDITKNHRRRWCSTAACGNRHKVSEFRKRQAKREG